MSRHHGTIEVDRPVRVVYDQWTQFEDFPDFMNGVEDVQQIDDTHNHWRVSIAGVEREFDTTITDQSPDSHIAWHSTSGSKVAGDVRFMPLDAGRTRVEIDLDFEPSGAVEKIGDALGVVKMEQAADLRRFKEFIESHDPTGAWRGDVTGGSTTTSNESPLDPTHTTSSARTREFDDLEEPPETIL